MEIFEKTLEGKPVSIDLSKEIKTSFIIKLNNFSDYYLYARRSMDRNVIGALNVSVSAKSEYAFLENSRNQISLIFILLYIIISLILILISIIILLDQQNPL